MGYNSKFLSMEEENEFGINGKENYMAIDNIRKASVAVVGGTMTTIGVVMIPLPTPFWVASLLRRG